jgi:hypothetical protein
MDKDDIRNQKLNQLKEDYNTEWWRPGKVDNYDLRSKVWGF